MKMTAGETIFHLQQAHDTVYQKLSLQNDIVKGPFTRAIFVAATQCNFCRAEVATSKSHV